MVYCAILGVKKQLKILLGMGSCQLVCHLKAECFVWTNCLNFLLSIVWNTHSGTLHLICAKIDRLVFWRDLWKEYKQRSWVTQNKFRWERTSCGNRVWSPIQSRAGFRIRHLRALSSQVFKIFCNWCSTASLDICPSLIDFIVKIIFSLYPPEILFAAACDYCVSSFQCVGRY